jgi:hypothetical protein
MHRLLCLALVLGLAPVASGVEPAPLPQQFQRGEPLLNRAPNDELRGSRPVSEAEVPPPAAPAHDILAVADIGQPIRAGRVTVWPLQARLPAAGGDFLTLDEASASGKITVEEVGDGGTVNVLHVSNTSSETIYLMAGEVLLGGKQDRVVGRSMLVPAGSRALEVPVYCVEHGRWQRQTEQFATSKKLAHSKLRRQVNAESQGAVWSEVAAANARLDADNPTDTYRASVKKLESDGDTQRAVATLRAGTAAVTRVAGVVFAVDGELRGLEWFASEGLYRKFEDKLFGSFVADATEGAAPPEGTRTPSREEVALFITGADQSAARAARPAGDGKVFLKESATGDGQTVYRAAEKAPVHKSWLKKP